MSFNCWKKWLFVIFLRCCMPCKYCSTVWFSESAQLCSERAQTGSVGTSWSITSIQRICYCLLTHRVTMDHGGFTVYHTSKWTAYEVHLNLRPILIPVRPPWPICQAVQAATCQVTTWPLVSWGWLRVMRWRAILTGNRDRNSLDWDVFEEHRSIALCSSSDSLLELSMNA